ncbi:MAG: murein biosynthesis integral membrane protein MurJ [Candidatus Erginobacter occultus]|nr:murein biosynthesis integral membrane protein MurJ [Candidatus Erginobacter occultus]
MNNSHPGQGEKASAGRKTSHQVTRSASVVGGATLVSRVLGLVRDILTAGVFGTGTALSAFVVAFTIPNLFRKLLGEGALTAAFVPVFTEYRERRGNGAGWRVASIIFSLSTLVLGALVVLGFILIWAITGTFELSERFLLVFGLLRIMLPYLFFICLVGLAMGILNSLRHFAVPAFSPVILNLVWIASLFFICPRFGEDPSRRIFGLAIGVLIGGAIQLGVQVPVLRKKGFPFKFIPDWRDPAARKIALLMGPGILGFAVFQINTALDGFLALVIGPNAPAALFFGNRLVQFPLGVFGLAFATAVLPVMARLMARGERAEFIGAFSHGLRSVLLITVPAAAGLIVLRRPIISLIFQRGAFGPESAAATAWVLLWYSLGLPAFAALKIITQGFYSCQDTKTPVKIGFCAMLLNLGLNLAVVFNPWLREHFREGGLALSTSIAALLNAGALYWLFRRRLGMIRGKELLAFLIRLLPTTAAMALACHYSLILISPRLPAAALPARILSVAVPVAAGLTVFALAVLVLKIDEARDLLRALKRNRPA